MAGRRLLIALCLLLAAAFAALGVWQVERRAWKLDLIAKVEARVHAPPRPLPAFSAPVRELTYLRVHVRGVFLHDRETLVQAVTDLGPGWWVMTPLRTDAGIVIVNRGYVTSERRAPAQRSAGQTHDLVTVTGLLRQSEPGGGFLRSNDPRADRWYSRDVAAIAARQGLARVAPYFIDADAARNAPGAPVGGLTVVAFSNNHLVYAITWYVLAMMTAAGFFYWITLRRRSDAV